MIVNGEKLACETCIRGHRVTQCQHTDRPLQQVSSKGRPVSQCDHCRSLRNSRSVHTRCKCGLAARNPTKQPGKDQCRCCYGEGCTCATKKDRPVTTSARKIASKSAQVSPSPSAESGLGGCCGSLQSPDSERSSVAPSTVDLASVHSDSVVPTDGLAPAGSQDWMAGLDLFLEPDTTSTLDKTTAQSPQPSFSADAYSLDAALDSVINMAQYGVDTDPSAIPIDWNWDALTTPAYVDPGQDLLNFHSFDSGLLDQNNLAYSGVAETTSPSTGHSENPNPPIRSDLGPVLDNSPVSGPL